MQVAIDPPNDFVAFQAAADIRQEVRASHAIWRHQHERVALAKTARIAGMSLHDFMGLSRSNQIPVIDVSRDELPAELAAFQTA